MNKFQTKAIATSVNDKDYTLDAVMTTEIVDRHGEIVDVDTMSVDSFMQNPVVLQFHNYDKMAVGKVTDVRRTTDAEGRKQLECTIKFAVEEYEVAKTMFELYKGGYMNAFSIGFRVGDWEQDPNTGVVRLTKCEMLEISCVAVPANALALAKSCGINVEKYVNTMPQDVFKKSMADAVKQIQALVEEPTKDAEPQDDTTPASEEKDTSESLPDGKTDESKSNEPEQIDTQDKSAILIEGNRQAKGNIKHILARAIRNLNNV